jgi:hypothetical protein
MQQQQPLAFEEVVAALQTLEEVRNAPAYVTADNNTPSLSEEAPWRRPLFESEEEAASSSSSAPPPPARLKQAAQEEVLRDLFRRVRGDTAQTLQLLRLLLPSEDRERVYGLKARRLMQVMASALAKAGRSEVAARLRRWAPDPSASALVRDAVVCLPEMELASAATASVRRVWTSGSIGAACAVCDTLTRAFLELQPGRETPEGGTETVQVEAFLGILRAQDGASQQQQMQRPEVLALDYHGWLLFARILLKRVSVGVGPATVFAALPDAHFVQGSAASLYARQRSLDALARAVTTTTTTIAQSLSSSASASSPGDSLLRCGVPFHPMTGDSLRSPYLLKYIFSREERLRRPIPPIDGRLVIVPNPREGEYEADPLRLRGDGARWFVSASHAMRMRLVPLEDEQVLQRANAQRRRHLLLLRDFKRAHLIDARHAGGLVLHYSLSAEEEGGLIVLLLRAASDAMGCGVELTDADAVMPPVAADFARLSTDEALRRLLRRPSVATGHPNRSEAVFVSGGGRRATHHRAAGGGGRWWCCCCSSCASCVSWKRERE